MGAVPTSYIESVDKFFSALGSSIDGKTLIKKMSDSETHFLPFKEQAGPIRASGSIIEEENPNNEPSETYKYVDARIKPNYKFFENIFVLSVFI